PTQWTYHQWLQAVSAIVAAVSTKYMTSGLPGENDPPKGGSVNLGKIAPFVVIALALGGCAKAPPTLSPAGTAAFHGTRVVKALDVLQDFAIAAEAQSPKLLSTDNTRKIVDFVGASAKLIDAAPGGWKPAVVAGLVELEHDLPPADWNRIAPYVNLIRVLISE